MRILFVCLGNICRSPMAEFLMRHLAAQAGLGEKLEAASAGTSDEEAGSPLYPPARRELARRGVPCAGHTARQITPADYDGFDMIIGMEARNLRAMMHCFGGDPAGKCSLLLAHAHPPADHTDVADPWYTRDFSAAWRDIESGCTGLLAELAPRL